MQLFGYSREELIGQPVEGEAHQRHLDQRVYLAEAHDLEVVLTGV